MIKRVHKKVVLVIAITVWYGFVLPMQMALASDLRFQQDGQTVTEPIFQLLLVDENDEPLVGLGVKNTRTAEIAISDSTGAARLRANSGDVLVLSLAGSFIREYTVASNLTPVLLLSSKHPAIAGQKPVRFPFQVSTPANLTASSTQAVYNNELTKMPVTSIRNALVGRLAGVYTSQNSGQPGADGVTMSLRGRSPLVLIDGIPRPLTTFDLEEIESITVLKDALSTAMLGVRGSDGALLVTTRKGTPTKQRISFTAQTAFQTPLKMPKPLNAYDYAQLYNEALRNDGLAPAYTDADLEGYRTQADPSRYPDVNWREQALKSSSRFDRYTLHASGGSTFARYFVSLEHFNQTGLLKENNDNSYNTNNDLKSYTIRSNVDLTITPKLSAGIHLFGRILNANDPGASTNSIFSALLTTPNNAYPVFNPNGSYGGNQLFQDNIWAQAVGSGYRQNYKRDMLADIYLRRTLDEITPGLWIKGMASVYATLSENIIRNKTFAVFQRNISPDQTESYQQFGTNGDQANGNGIEYQGRADYAELSIGYDRKFNQHGINAVIIGNRDNSVSGSNLPYTITGTSGRVAYNFKEKYVAEFAFGLNGSNWYPPAGTTKYGFFPAFGLAWNMHKEDFLSKATWLNQLKVYGSYGKTGWDNPGYFTYIQRYFDGAGAYFGTSAGFNTSMNEQPLANPNVTWEKANKLNLGVQGAVLDNKLSFVAEYYNTTYYDLLMQRGKSIAMLGNTYPDENIGRNRYMGGDFQLTWQQSIRQVNYFISANAGVQDSKVLFKDEVYQPYDWMKETGQRVNQPFGLIAEGLFQTQAEINSSATITGYSPQPGDIKYRDLNQDGVIDQLDVTAIGIQKPRISYGINLGLKWKFLDFSALIQGVVNQDLYLAGYSEWAFLDNGLRFGQAYDHHLNRWTPQNAANATYPRLGVGYKVNNQRFSSDYWIHSGNYARLKLVELGFTIPTGITRKAHLQSVRLFVNGTNLFTLSAFDRVDPEGSNGLYPIQKITNLGINLKF